MNIKRWKEEKQVGDWRVSVEYGERVGSPFWAVRISPAECGWICTVAEWGRKEDAMKDFRTLQSPEVITEIYKRNKEIRDNELSQMFGESLRLAERVMCGARRER